MSSSSIIGNSIRISLRSFDHRSLDFFTRNVVERVLKTGAKVVGPIPLPVEKNYKTVNRSPTIDKKSREHFVIKVYKRLLVLRSTNPQTMEELTRLELPAGVEVLVKSDRG